MPEVWGVGLRVYGLPPHQGAKTGAFRARLLFNNKPGPKLICFSLGAQGFGLRFKALALACGTLAPERFSLVADTRTSPGRLHMAALPDLAAPAELDAMDDADIPEEVKQNLQTKNEEELDKP